MGLFSWLWKLIASIFKRKPKEIKSTKVVGDVTEQRNLMRGELKYIRSKSANIFTYYSRACNHIVDYLDTAKKDVYYDKIEKVRRLLVDAALEEGSSAKKMCVISMYRELRELADGLGDWNEAKVKEKVIRIIRLYKLSNALTNSADVVLKRSVDKNLKEARKEISYAREVFRAIRAYFARIAKLVPVEEKVE